MIATIVKIDLVGSKTVSAANQLKNPAIRKQLLEKLIEISKSKFPQSDQKYPVGSYYKAEGDAVYFILDKPTVALRAAIEFMQGWFINTITQGDRIQVMRQMPANSVDFILTDPPYLVNYCDRDGRTIQNDTKAEWLKPSIREAFLGNLRAL